MIEELFLIITAIVFTGFGWFVGRSSGMKQGIADTVDSLIQQGFLKWRGSKSNPEVLKWNEE